MTLKAVLFQVEVGVCVQLFQQLEVDFSLPFLNARCFDSLVFLQAAVVIFDIRDGKLWCHYKCSLMFLKHIIFNK